MAGSTVIKRRMIRGMPQEAFHDDLPGVDADAEEGRPGPVDGAAPPISCRTRVEARQARERRVDPPVRSGQGLRPMDRTWISRRSGRDRRSRSARPRSRARGPARQCPSTAIHADVEWVVLDGEDAEAVGAVVMGVLGRAGGGQQQVARLPLDLLTSEIEWLSSSGVPASRRSAVASLRARWPPERVVRIGGRPCVWG
jgi:hypothetical protein